MNTRMNWNIYWKNFLLEMLERQAPCDKVYKEER